MPAGSGDAKKKTDDGFRSKIRERMQQDGSVVSTTA